METPASRAFAGAPSEARRRLRAPVSATQQGRGGPQQPPAAVWRPARRGKGSCPYGPPHARVGARQTAAAVASCRLLPADACGRALRPSQAATKAHPVACGHKAYLLAGLLAGLASCKAGAVSSGGLSLAMAFPSQRFRLKCSPAAEPTPASLWRAATYCVAALMRTPLASMSMLP